MIQLGYWIVEGLVNRPQEEYPRGGLKYLVGGCMLPCCYLLPDADPRIELASGCRDERHSRSSRATRSTSRESDVRWTVSD